MIYDLPMILMSLWIMEKQILLPITLYRKNWDFKDLEDIINGINGRPERLITPSSARLTRHIKMAFI